MTNNSKKNHVGKFSITDKDNALVVTGKVEHNQSFVSELFFIEVFPFDKSKNFISFAFSIVEFRSFANQLEELQYNVIPQVKKHSGGNTNSKSLTISSGTMSESFLFEFVDRNVKILFSMPSYLLSGFSKQIIHLANSTMDAVYKTQQHESRKSSI